MKKIKTYNNFNESLKDKLVGKSDNEIKKSIKDLDALSIIKYIENGKIPSKFMPSDDEIKNSFGEEKYKIWKIYNQIINLPKPFDITDYPPFHSFNNYSNRIKFRFYWVYFELSNNGKKWFYVSKYNDHYKYNNIKEGELNSWEEIFNEMKKDIHKYFDMEKEQLNKEIKRYQDNIKDYDESLLKLDNM